MTRREPTIPIEDVERRARDVLGDKLTRIEFKSRKGRSERVTLHVPGGTLAFTHASYADPDAVRKAVLQFLDDCMATANETVRRMLDSKDAAEKGDGT